jgi:nicotinate-nucleotide pyrophosphorylase (carboxylating)
MASLPVVFTREVKELIALALREDIGSGDLTSRALIGSRTRIEADLVAKASGVVAGIPFAIEVFKEVDRRIAVKVYKNDGNRLKVGDKILSVSGPARSVLAAERTAVNIVGQLSGIATLTSEFIHRAGCRKVSILDTRKTRPGFRFLEKHAVKAGGGRSHRMGLYDAVLIKTNHLRAMNNKQGNSYRKNRSCLIPMAVSKALKRYPNKFVEIEVANFSEFRAALSAHPHAILLDNWKIPDIKRAALLRDSQTHILHSKILLEASGSVSLGEVRSIASTGVDRISIGQLTHSARFLDVALRVKGG